MADVFISYKREDRPVVERLSAALNDLDLDVWFDQALEVGERWADRILKEVESAKAVIVCWSPDALKSSWVLRECAIAAHRAVLVPVILRACDPPAAFGSIQAEHWEGWDGDASDARFLKILPLLGRLTGRSDIALKGRQLAGAHRPDIIALIRRMLVERARSGAAPFTYVEAEARVRELAADAGMDLGDFAQPTLWGVLDEIAEQNRRNREPPLGCLVVGEYELPGRGYFQKHVFLDGLHDTLEQQVFARHLERVRAFTWPRDP